MSDRARVLITGLSGFLGRALEQERPSDWSVTGSTRSITAISVLRSEATWLECDLENADSVERCVARAAPSVIVHAAGEANVDNAQSVPSRAIASNVVSSVNLAEACRRNGIHLIYVSSNAVFSGNEAPYDEAAEPNPVNHYGLIKLTGERVALHINPQTTIVRPILMYGWNHALGRSNPVLTTIRKLRAGEPIKMVDDVFENPLYGRECAKAIWKVAMDGLLGTYHIAGGTTVHRYDLAVQTARTFGLDERLISRVQSREFPSIAPRPANTVFNTARMESELSLAPISLIDGLNLMKCHEE